MPHSAVYRAGSGRRLLASSPSAPRFDLGALNWLLRASKGAARRCAKRRRSAVRRTYVHPSADRSRPTGHPSTVYSSADHSSVHPLFVSRSPVCAYVSPLCPSVRLSVRSSFYPSVHPSVYPSVHPSVCLSVRPSVRPSIRSSVRLSVCPSIRLSVRPSVRLSVRPSVRPSVRLSVRPSVHPYAGRAARRNDSQENVA